MERQSSGSFPGVERRQGKLNPLFSQEGYGIIIITTRSPHTRLARGNLKRSGRGPDYRCLSACFFPLSFFPSTSFLSHPIPSTSKSTTLLFFLLFPSPSPTSLWNHFLFLTHCSHHQDPVPISAHSFFFLLRTLFRPPSNPLVLPFLALLAACLLPLGHTPSCIPIVQ